MLELVATRVSVIGAFALPDALDGLRAGPGTVCRIAPDESMAVAEVGDGEYVAEAVGASLRTDPDALVLETTDGWTVWSLHGPEASEAFSVLSEVRFAAGFLQGEVASVPCRVIAPAPTTLHVLVPAMWGEYVRGRIVSDCSRLGLAIAEEPRDWSHAAGPVSARSAATDERAGP